MDKFTHPELGKRLRWLRGQRHMSADTLAEIVGITVPRLYQIEQGNFAKLNLDIYLKICDALDVGADYLIHIDRQVYCDPFWNPIVEMIQKLNRSQYTALYDYLQFLTKKNERGVWRY